MIDVLVLLVAIAAVVAVVLWVPWVVIQTALWAMGLVVAIGLAWLYVMTRK